MKRFTVILAAMLCITAIQVDLFPENGWNLLRDEQGIRIYSRPVPGSSIDEYMGVTIIKAPVETVQKVLGDISSHVIWRYNCIESRIIRKKDDSDMIIYTITKTPWPLSYRDVVLNVTRRILPDKNTVIINMKALTQNLVPMSKKYVRIRKLEGKWVLERKGAGRTLITYTNMLDPAGSIPESMANRASSEMPFNTLRGLHRMVEKICSGHVPRI